MLLKIILFIVVIFLVIRFFSRFLLSLFISNINDRISQAQHNFTRNNSRKEGDVIINATRKNDKKYSNNEGEYVDFEEIK